MQENLKMTSEHGKKILKKSSSTNRLNSMNQVMMSSMIPSLVKIVGKPNTIIVPDSNPDG